MKPFTYVMPTTLAEAGEAAKKPDTIVKGAGLDLVERRTPGARQDTDAHDRGSPR